VVARDVSVNRVVPDVGVQPDVFRAEAARRVFESDAAEAERAYTQARSAKRSTPQQTPDEQGGADGTFVALTSATGRISTGAQLPDLGCTGESRAPL